MRLLAEGVHPARIEMAALKAGMPVGPLAIQDEVSLTLTEHVASETRKALQAEGKELPKTPVDEVIHTMIHELNRKVKLLAQVFMIILKMVKHLWEGLNRWQKIMISPSKI